MTKNSKLLLALLPAFVLSCIGLEQPEGSPGVPGGESVVIPVKLSCELLDTEESASRSVHDLSTLRKISNANYYIFQNSILLEQGYFEDADEFALTLPSKDGVYDLYILANVGEYPVASGISKSEMAASVHVDYGGHDDYFSTIENYGFPMSLIVGGFSASSSADLKLRRLVHTLYVTVDTEALKSTEMKFTGLSIRNAARDVYPFASESRALHVMDGDSADVGAEELDALNRGETITLYLLENMRGEVFPGNDDWKNKMPDRMTPASERNFASFVELTAEVQTATAHYDRNVYRAYLGASAADCNVKRHSYFRLNNRFTNDMILDDGWRVDGDDPVVNQELAFVDTRYTMSTAPNKDASGDVPYRPFREVDAFYTVNGALVLYYIYRSNPGIEYTVTMTPNNQESADCEEYVRYEVREVDDNFSALFVETTYPFKDNGERYTSDPSFTSGKSVTFTVESADGFISDRLVCKILDRPFSVRFKYDGVYPAVVGGNWFNDGRLNMYFTNPLGMRVGVNMEGKVEGRNIHEPNGGIGGEKTEYYTAYVNTGNRHRDGDKVEAIEQNSDKVLDVVPLTGVGTRVDLYTPRLEVGVGTFYRSIDGFNEYFDEIHRNTAWHDWTFLGTSGADKHAEPYYIELSLNMAVKSPNPNRIVFTSDIPVYLDNNRNGTDIGFIFNHSDYHSFTKAIYFNTESSISFKMNEHYWRGDLIYMNIGNGSDVERLKEAMIAHRLKD